MELEIAPNRIQGNIPRPFLRKIRFERAGDYRAYLLENFATLSLHTFHELKTDRMLKSMKNQVKVLTFDLFDHFQVIFSMSSFRLARDSNEIHGSVAMGPFYF